MVWGYLNKDPGQEGGLPKQGHHSSEKVQVNGVGEAWVDSLRRRKDSAQQPPQRPGSTHCPDPEHATGQPKQYLSCLWMVRLLLACFLPSVCWGRKGLLCEAGSSQDRFDLLSNTKTNKKICTREYIPQHYMMKTQIPLIHEDIFKVAPLQKPSPSYNSLQLFHKGIL